MDPESGWHILGQSVRGYAHHRSGLPNQDALHWLPASGVGPPLIVTVADGHGSAKSFRSHVGARIAVEETAWLIQDLLDGQPDPRNLSAVKRTAEERLPREIARRWSDSVTEHLRKNPFRPEELAALEAAQGSAARQQVEDHPPLAYGATVLAVLVTADFVMYLQLGDGDVLVVAEDGTVSRPMPGDERLFANETTSLCMVDAWREVRFRFQALYGDPPALILLATDGYANSFVNDEAFCRVGSDLLQILQDEGPGYIADSLEGWLNHVSKEGSGDDITVGLLYRTAVLRSRAEEAVAPDTQAIPDEAALDELAASTSQIPARRSRPSVKHAPPREPSKRPVGEQDAEDG